MAERHQGHTPQYSLIFYYRTSPISLYSGHTHHFETSLLYSEHPGNTPPHFQSCSGESKSGQHSPS